MLLLLPKGQAYFMLLISVIIDRRKVIKNIMKFNQLVLDTVRLGETIL